MIACNSLRRTNFCFSHAAHFLIQTLFKILCNFKGGVWTWLKSWLRKNINVARAVFCKAENHKIRSVPNELKMTFIHIKFQGIFLPPIGKWSTGLHPPSLPRKKQRAVQIKKYFKMLNKNVVPNVSSGFWETRINRRRMDEKVTKVAVCLFKHQATLKILVYN